MCHATTSQNQQLIGLPDAAEQGGEEEADDDLDDLGDAPILGEVGSVRRAHCFSFAFLLE